MASSVLYPVLNLPHPGPPPLKQEAPSPPFPPLICPCSTALNSPQRGLCTLATLSPLNSARIAYYIQTGLPTTGVPISRPRTWFLFSVYTLWPFQQALGPWSRNAPALSQPSSIPHRPPRGTYGMVSFSGSPMVTWWIFKAGLLLFFIIFSSPFLDPEYFRKQG